MIQFSSDEARALSFVALLLALAAAARLLDGRGALDDDVPAVDASALAQAADSAREAGERARRPLAAGERIDPNTARAEELDRLPRVGPAVARRIVAERERAGPFRTVQDLRRVKGLGASTVEALAPHLALPSAPEGTAAGDGAGARELRPQAVVRALGGGTGPARQRGAPPAGAAGRLDVNRATAAELERLPGIGPALAGRIVAYRDSVGPFRSTEELERVRGIGPALLRRLLPHVTVAP